mgnify:CR=1 FL=1
MKKYLFYSLFAGLFILFLFVTGAEAQNTQDQAGALLVHPNYKKTELLTYICENGTDTCSHEQSKRSELKWEKSVTFTVLAARMGVPVSDIQTASKHDTTKYRSYFTKLYGLKTCESEHTYKSFMGLLSVFTPTKIGTAETKLHTFCTGEKGADYGTQSQYISPPDILYEPQIGGFTVTVPSQGFSVKHEVTEKGPSMIILLPPDVKDENQVKKFAGDLIKSEIQGKLPIVGSIIVNKFLEDNWLVPLLVKVTELVPVVANGSISFEEKSVPCKDVNVAGQTLDSDCHVTFTMTKRKPALDVTPSTKATYYRYEIKLAGPILKKQNAQAYIQPSSLFAAVSESLGPTQSSNNNDEVSTVNLDPNGFWLIDGWDNEDLPIVNDNLFTSTPFTPTMSQTAPYVGHAASSEQIIKKGESVKVYVADSKTPPPDFVTLASGEKVAKPQTCLDASGAGTFKTNPKQFTTGWDNDARCAQGISDATSLQQKISDLNTSIAVTQNFIDSLTFSIKETKDLNTFDGASFFIIPVGERQDKSYGQVKDIKVQCVSGKSMPVGTNTISSSPIYADLSAKITAQTNAVKQKILQSYQAYIKESPTDRGTVINSTLNRLVALKDTLTGGSFTLITANALSKYHQSAIDAGVAIPLSVKLELDSNNKEKKCTIGTWANAQLNVLGSDVLASGNFLISNISLNGNIFERDCVPQTYLLQKMKDGLTKNIADFRTKKTKYESLLKQAQIDLVAIQNVKYFCDVDPIFNVTAPYQGKAASSEQVIKLSVPAPAVIYSPSPTQTPSSTPTPTPSPTPTQTPIGIANLVASSVSVSGSATGVSNQLYAGNMTIYGVINNNGTAPSSASTARFQYSTNNDYFVDWVSQSVPSLPQGQSQSLSYTWTGGTGTYYFRLCTANNNCSSPVRVDIINKPVSSPSSSPSPSPSSSPVSKSSFVSFFANVFEGIRNLFWK